ncbi:hypothetical protein [Paraburkholderia diazotrophica]|uniref:Uncharacterized protein n=1 Tax=Paraburkholderia diazotrophica TaxID=667676 RepID=A0A1H6VRW8_9BURK|nr:hypothetical protein [Paraburkholderia diazotrophica]SEJ02765.1 hypothetical protein SAMN05192539_10063 [Paraburkholderia diazotrophica]
MQLPVGLEEQPVGEDVFTHSSHTRALNPFASLLHPIAKIVVGDRIKAKCQDERLMSITEVEHMLPTRTTSNAPLVLHVGQGIEYARLERLYARVHRGEQALLLQPPQLVRHPVNTLNN